MINTKYKNLTIIIFLSFLAVVTGRALKRVGNQLFTPEQTTPLFNQYINTPLCDGYDWQQIEKLTLSHQEKEEIKENLIKIVIETSAFQGMSIFEARVSLEEYKDYLDNFYQEKDNVQLPLFFALRIADMDINGTPTFILEQYKSAVMKKLREAGLIKGRL